MIEITTNAKYVAILKSHSRPLTRWNLSLPEGMMFTKFLERTVKVVKIVDQRNDHDKKYGNPIEHSLDNATPGLTEIHNSCDFRTTVLDTHHVKVRVRDNKPDNYLYKNPAIAEITFEVEPSLITPILLKEIERLSVELEEQIEEARREKIRKEILKGLKDATFTKDQLKLRKKWL